MDRKFGKGQAKCGVNMYDFNETNGKILKIIQEMAVIDKFLGGIPLQEIYKQIKIQKVLTESWAIKKHIRILADSHKIEIIGWSVKVL